MGDTKIANEMTGSASQDLTVTTATMRTQHCFECQCDLGVEERTICTWNDALAHRGNSGAIDMMRCRDEQHNGTNLFKT